MKKIILVFAGLVAVSTAGAQQKWTLAQCIEYAVENNIEIRQTALNVENAALDLNTTQNSRLPSLEAGVNQSFGFGRTSLRYTDEETGAVYDRYENSQTSSTGFSLGAGMALFQGFRISNQVKAGRLDLQAAAEGLERAKQNLELNVAGYYLDVLFKKEILAVYRQQSALTLEQVENTTRMVDEGKVARSQLYDIEAQYAQNRVSEVNAENDLSLSLLNLAQALDLPPSPDFDVAEVDADGIVPAAPALARSPETLYQTALGVKPAVREAELRLQSSQLGVKIAQSGFWPSLNLSANVNSGYQYVFGQNVPQPDFSDQMRDQLREGVGLNMSIPIFNRNSTRNSVRAARLGVMNQTLALQGVKQALYKEIQQAHQRAVAAEARYRATLEATKAATESFRAMELRYTSGKATVYEYSEANTTLISSRSEQMQAKYDYLFSTKILDFYAGERIDI
jgi:outer membrane protein